MKTGRLHRAWRAGASALDPIAALLFVGCPRRPACFAVIALLLWAASAAVYGFRHQARPCFELVVETDKPGRLQVFADTGAGMDSLRSSWARIRPGRRTVCSFTLPDGELRALRLDLPPGGGDYVLSSPRILAPGGRLLQRANGRAFKSVRDVRVGDAGDGHLTVCVPRDAADPILRIRFGDPVVLRTDYWSGKAFVAGCRDGLMAPCLAGLGLFLLAQLARRRRLGVRRVAARLAWWLRRAFPGLRRDTAAVRIVLVAFLFGVIFAMVTPPFQGADESEHMARACHLSQGGWSLTRQEGMRGAWLPVSLAHVEWLTAAGIRYQPDAKVSLARIREALGTPLEPAHRVFRDMTPTQFALPVPYLHQAAAVAVARCFTTSALWPLYAGRLANAVLYSLLVWLAIRRMPCARWSLLVVALSPMSLFLAGSVSYDPPAYGLAFLMLALLLEACLGPPPGRIARRAMALSLTAGALLMTKLLAVAYLPLFPLAAGRRPGRRSATVLWTSLAVSLLVAAALTWAIAFRDAVPDTRTGADPAAQVAGIVAHPGVFGRIVAAAARERVSEWMESFVGRLGWLDTDIGGAARSLWWTLAIIALVIDMRPAESMLSRGGRALAGLTLVLALAGLLVLMYVTWTPPGHLGIWGIQGRYFIPLAPLVPLALLPSLPIRRPWRILGRAAIGFGLPVVLGTAVFRTVLRYYV